MVHLLTFILRPANCVIAVINLSIFLDIACFIFTLLIFRVLLEGSVYLSTEQRRRVEKVKLEEEQVCEQTHGRKWLTGREKAVWWVGTVAVEDMVVPTVNRAC